jgi:hypothetical protein
MRYGEPWWHRRPHSIAGLNRHTFHSTEWSNPKRKWRGASHFKNFHIVHVSTKQEWKGASNFKNSHVVHDSTKREWSGTSHFKNSHIIKPPHGDVMTGRRIHTRECKCWFHRNLTGIDPYILKLTIRYVSLFPFLARKFWTEQYHHVNPDRGIWVYSQTEASPIPFRRPKDLRKDPSATIASVMQTNRCKIKRLTIRVGITNEWIQNEEIGISEYPIKS